MKVNGITNYAANNRIGFNGHWETTSREKYIGYWNGQIKSYVPDNNESLKDIAIAWKRETGELPSEWVKTHNTYNQENEPVEYRIKGSPYMPVAVLRASVLLEAEQRGNYPLDNINKYIQLAKISAQLGDFDRINEYEDKICDNFYQIKGAKLEEMAAFDMNNYKEGWGSDVKAKKRYVLN